jgi:hypothetical protein
MGRRARTATARKDNVLEFQEEKRKPRRRDRQHDRRLFRTVAWTGDQRKQEKGKRGASNMKPASGDED